MTFLQLNISLREREIERVESSVPALKVVRGEGGGRETGDIGRTGGKKCLWVKCDVHCLTETQS